MLTGIPGADRKLIFADRIINFFPAGVLFAVLAFFIQDPGIGAFEDDVNPQVPIPWPAALKELARNRVCNTTIERECSLE